MMDPHYAALLLIERLTASLVEADRVLGEGESSDQACPVCRGVTGHHMPCCIRLARDVIQNGLRLAVVA